MHMNQKRILLIKKLKFIVSFKIVHLHRIDQRILVSTTNAKFHVILI